MNLRTTEKPNSAELSKLTVPATGRYEIARQLLRKSESIRIGVGNTGFFAERPG